MENFIAGLILNYSLSEEVDTAFGFQTASVSSVQMRLYRVCDWTSLHPLFSSLAVRSLFAVGKRDER